MALYELSWRLGNGRHPAGLAGAIMVVAVEAANQQWYAREDRRKIGPKEVPEDGRCSRIALCCVALHCIAFHDVVLQCYCSRQWWKQFLRHLGSMLHTGVPAYAPMEINSQVPMEEDDVTACEGAPRHSQEHRQGMLD